MNDTKNNMTLIVFSNDMDKAIAAFILATGAASAGMNVTVFFTFWGLSLLRNKRYRRKGKTLVERMFGWMLPEGPTETKLSKMHMFGAGTSMMKQVMKRKRMPQPEYLMEMARTLGVRLVACTTSMEMMGMKTEELLDGIEVGGVATYLGSAREAGVNLFI